MKKEGLLSLLGAGAVLLANGNCGPCRNDLVVPRAIVTNQTQEEEKSPEYNAIREKMIVDFLRDYLERVTPQSSTFRKLDERFGREGTLEKYALAHELCIGLAFSGRTPTEEDYWSIGGNIAGRQQEMNEGVTPVNYTDRKVVESFTEWGKLKTEFFIRLYQTNERRNEGETEKDFVNKIVRKAFTREEYAAWVSRMNDSCDRLYDSMKGTLNPVERLFGEIQFETIKRETRSSYNKTIEEYFGSK